MEPGIRPTFDAHYWFGLKRKVVVQGVVVLLGLRLDSKFYIGVIQGLRGGGYIGIR